MRRAVTTLIIVAVICVVALLLYRTLSQYQLADIRDALTLIPPFRIALAASFAAGSYLCLTGFDALAVRYVGHPLPYRQTALASFTALSLGHNIGLAALSSGAIRYRFYSRWGLSAGEVAKVIIFCGVTVGLGLATLAGGALLLRPELAETTSGLGRSAILVIGLLLLFVPLTYLAVAVVYRGKIGFGRWSMQSPSPALAAGQVTIGTVNFAMVAACLHQTLAAISDVDYGTIASTYAIANATAILSHVPGGLGVIESVVLLLLPGAPVIAALIMFRVIYFFVPLMFGGAMLAVSELVIGDRTAKARTSRPSRSASSGRAKRV